MTLLSSPLISSRRCRYGPISSCFHSFSVFPVLSVCVCEWVWSSGSGSCTPAADLLISPPCLHTWHQSTNHHAQHKDLSLLATLLYLSVSLCFTPWATGVACRFPSHPASLSLTPKITPFFIILTIHLLKWTSCFWLCVWVQIPLNHKTFSCPLWKYLESVFICMSFFQLTFKVIGLYFN